MIAIAPQHHGGAAIVALRKALADAGFECGEIAWNHADGRHAMRVTVNPAAFAGAVELEPAR